MKTAPITPLVSKYYHDHYDALGNKQFHFSSRHYLWFRDKKSLARLKANRIAYIGSSPEETRMMFVNMLEEKDTETTDRNEYALRAPILKKYPRLTRYNKILFKVLFAKELFGYDTSAIALDVLPIKDLLTYRDRLYKNPKDLCILSTFALNFIYTLEYVLDLAGKRTHNKIDPLFLLATAQRTYKTNRVLARKFNLQLYYYTHCVINASRFYARPITKHKTAYRNMLRECEQIISSHYFDISLDNKVEFLVCCRLLGYRTPLFEIVSSECAVSLSDGGTYIVDTYNAHRDVARKKDLLGSEHRNILFLMAFGKR